MRSAATLFFLVSLSFAVLTVVSAQDKDSGRICPLGGAVPAECPDSYHWDGDSCRWVCNADVNCFVDPCLSAAKKNICPFESCTADYSRGCNFKCSKCTKTCASKKCPRGTECVQDEDCKLKCKPKICVQGGAPPAECSAEGQYKWDNKACKWVCNGCRSNEGAFVPIGETYYDKCNSCTCGENGQSKCTKIGCNTNVCYNDQGKEIPCRPVQCLVDPCENAARDGLCPFELCTADYSKGCDFKCSKPICTETCAAVTCDAGTECVQGDDCTAQCKPAPTKPNICPQGGQVPAECAGEGQHEWDNKACKWVCKCRSNEGNWVSIGERYKDKCNSCTCGANGSSTCTKIGCSGLGVCFDDQGKGYDKDDTMMQKCNTCTCGSNGQWGCTKMACIDPTPAPTTPAPGPKICVQGGKVPPECPTTNVWDSKACKFVCVAPPSRCSGLCASTTCLTGTVCEIDQKCNVKCTPLEECTNKCTSGKCGPGAECVMNTETCAAECKPSSCPNLCTVTFCHPGKQCRMNGCKAECFDTTGVVVLSAKFTVTMTKSTNTKADVSSAMRRVAERAGRDVAEAFVISKDDITTLIGNSFNYKWSAKIGIKGPTDTAKSLFARYVAQASTTTGLVRTANADQDVATVESETDLTTEEAMMAMQSCPDGSEISAADQCPVDTFAVPTTSSSSSSTPLVAIIVPIIAGVVLIAIIATAVVVLRRRANTIKSINNVQQDTQMTQRV